MAELPKDILSVVADIASIIGFGVTIVVAVAVRRLRAMYLFKGRAPHLTTRIATIASEISTLAADFGNTREQIIVELRRVAVLIESLAKKSGRGDRAATKQLAQRINRSQIFTRAEVTELYGEIQALIARYEELQRDQEWQK